MACLAITSTADTAAPFAWIRFRVSIAIRCWLCLDVRNRIVPPRSSATSRAATRATAVFPIPVGAWARRWAPARRASRASERNSAWPPRTRSNGHGIRGRAPRDGNASNRSMAIRVTRAEASGV